MHKNAWYIPYWWACKFFSNFALAEMNILCTHINVYLGQTWKNERGGFKGMCIKFQWEKCQTPQMDPLALGTAQWGWRARVLCPVAGYEGRIRGALGVYGWLDWVVGVGREASISQQASSLDYAQPPGSMTEPAAPSWLGWLLCAGGAGVGEAAGALAHSGLGMWGGSSPALMSSQQWLSQPPPPTRTVWVVP